MFAVSLFAGVLRPLCRSLFGFLSRQGEFFRFLLLCKSALGFEIARFVGCLEARHLKGDNENNATINKEKGQTYCLLLELSFLLG